MPRKSRLQDPNFFEELRASSIGLPIAVQNEFAAMVSRAYSSQTLGVPQSQIPSLPISHPLIDQYLPGVTTMGGLEDALNRSLITPLMGMTQRIVENKGAVDPSAIFSDLYFGALDASRTYQPTYKGKPTTFSHFAQRSAFQAASAGNRREMRGLSIDQFLNEDGELLPGTPSALTVDDYVPGGQTAPYTAPSKRWYDPLTKVQSAIPSPFYAPEGEGFLTGGQLNPHLKFKPGTGLSQVSIQPNEMRQYIREVATDSSLFREQPKPVQRFLKQTAEGLRGGGFISTDAEVLGAVAGADQALVETMMGNSSDRFDYTGVEIDREMLARSARVRNLPGLIQKVAFNDPATAAAMYLQGAAEGKITPRDIRDIGVPSGDKNLGEYVSNNFDELTDALNVIEQGYGYQSAGPEELQRVVEQLRAINPRAIQSGEMIAEGNMRGIRVEDTATYNQGRDAVRRATVAAEQAQRERMGLSEPARAAVVDDTPSVPEPEAPPDFGVYSRTRPSGVSDAGKVAQTLNQPASTQSVAQASSVPAAREVRNAQPITLQTQAVRAREYLMGSRDFVEGYGAWIGGGAEKGPAFLEWLSEIGGPDAPAAWDTLMKEKGIRTGLGGNSEFSNMIQSRPAWKAAHTKAQKARASQTENNVVDAGAASTPAADASTAASITASSSGSGGGNGSVPPTTTSAPAEPEGPRRGRRNVHGTSGRSDEPTSEDIAWMNEQDALNATAARSRGGFETTPLRVTGEWSEEQVQRQLSGISEERVQAARAAADSRPMSNREQLLTSEAALKKMMGVEVANVYREGNYHGTYGLYRQKDLEDPSKGGDFYSQETAQPTLRNETIQMGQKVYQAAVAQAFDAGGTDGLSNREFAATIHKRVQEGIKKIVDDKVKEWDQAAPETSAQNRALGNQLKNVADNFLTRGDAELRLTADTSKIGDVNRTSINARGKNLDKYYGSDDEAGRAFKERIDELGGPGAARSGPRRVVMAGDNSYEIGADDWDGSSGYGRGQGIKSIYSEPIGHAMMAQFMASMAWKSTGGAVMQSAGQYATGQYGMIGLSAFGGGQLSDAELTTARQEVAANRSGSLAYQQYGVFGDMGYLLSAAPGGENIMRFGNDLKMMAGAGAVAGIGTWGLGALFGSTALTAAAPFVGAGAAAAVGIPSLGFSLANAVTGSNDYGWKQSLSGMMVGLAATERYGNWSLAGQDMWTVEGQEKYATERGTSTKDIFQGTWIGRQLGAEGINYFTEGRDPVSKALQPIIENLQLETGQNEDVIRKQLGSLQVAFGGLDSGTNRTMAGYMIKQAAEQGVDANALLANASTLAGQRGILEGTEEFMSLATNFAGMDLIQQQKELLKSSRNFQKYSQWVPYLEGGNAEGYGLFNQLGGDVNMAGTQAIQQVFAQAQMAGVNITPGMASMLATRVDSMKPWMAMDATRMASSLTQIGAGSFTSNFGDIVRALRNQDFGFSDIGNGNITLGGGSQNDTFQFIQGVTSGNQYALSDYGRMAGIGELQIMDKQGLQAGLKDMSGLLAFANQNILRTNNPWMTRGETLAGLGMTFGSTDQTALLTGGIWGYQQSYVNQTNALQQSSLGLQFQQLASNRNFMYQSWGIEDQMTQTQWQSQLNNFSFSNLMMDTQREHRLEDAALQREQRGLSQQNSTWTRDFDYQTSLMKRDWARDDYQFSTQMRQLNYGWNMEEVNEQIRRSSGYERAQLIKQRDRMNLSENLQSGQAEKQFERQEELWEREDERYKKGVEFNQQMLELDNRRFELNQEQAEELYQLNKQHLAEEIDSATRLHELRLEMEALQREKQEEQLRYSEQSLNIQQQLMTLQNEYQNNMTILGHTQTEMEANLRKITSYSPAFSRMLSDFLNFLEEASHIQPSTSGASVTYR